MNLELILAIIAIISALSPSIVTLISNIHSLKIKQYENIEYQKNLAIKNYIEYSALKAYSDNGHYDESYYKSLADLLLYIPYSIVSDFESNPNQSTFKELVPNVAKYISHGQLKLIHCPIKK